MKSKVQITSVTPDQIDPGSSQGKHQSNISKDSVMPTTSEPVLDNSTAPCNSENVTLVRGIGLLEAVGITVGGIVGSGIFISPKGITDQVHSVGASLLIWLISGVLTMLGALSYAELGTTFPSAGGQYTYIFEAWGPVMAFLFMWTHSLIFVPVEAAVASLVFSKYLIQPFFYSGCKVPSLAVQLCGAGTLCILSFINCFNMRVVTRFINVFMYLKLSAVFLVIIGGFYALFTNGTNNFSDPWDNSTITSSSVVYSLFAGAFAFGGWASLNTMIEELVDPSKNMPRAIVISITLITAIYLLANVSYFTVLSPQEIVRSDAVAVTFVEQLFGPKITWIVPMFVSISVLGFLSIHLLINSRNCYVGARSGHFPQVLALITTAYSSPAPAIIFQCLLSLIFLYTADVFLLINFIGMLKTAYTALCLASLLFLRWKRPDLERPFKIPIIVPVICFILTMGFVILPIYVDPINSAISVVLSLSGLPVYYLLVNKDDQSKIVQKISAYCTVSVQKLMMSVKEDSSDSDKQK